MRMLSLSRFFRRRRTYRTVLQELSGYSDHELHDIGIDRVDIHEIARRIQKTSGKRRRRPHKASSWSHSADRRARAPNCTSVWSGANR